MEVTPKVRLALRRAEQRAGQAPTPHFSRTWRFRSDARGLDMGLTPQRPDGPADPGGRAALLTCGRALFDARASLAASGVPCQVRRLPGGDYSPVFARLEVNAPDVEMESLRPVGWSDGARGGEVIEGQLPRALVARWAAVARSQGATLVQLLRADDRAATDALTRGAGDALTPGQALLVLGTADDDPLAWLRSGEALQSVLATMSHGGCADGATIRTLEPAAMRAALRRGLGASFHPQVVIVAAGQH